MHFLKTTRSCLALTKRETFGEKCIRHGINFSNFILAEGCMHFRNRILQKHVTTHRSSLSPAARSFQQRKMSFYSSKTNPYWKSFSITVKSISLQFSHARPNYTFIRNWCADKCEISSTFCNIFASSWIKFHVLVGHVIE